MRNEMKFTHKTRDDKPIEFAMLAHPNDGDRMGFLRLSIASTTDSHYVSLTDMAYVSQIVQVLRGMREHTDDIHVDGVSVDMTHSGEWTQEKGGFALTMCDDHGCITFRFTPDEALMLMLCVERSVPYIMMGI